MPDLGIITTIQPDLELGFFLFVYIFAHSLGFGNLNE